MLPFLSNVNDLVSSDEKDEVETMMDAIPKISKAVTNYVSHRLCEISIFPNGCNYSVNEDRTIHCLHDSIPQVEGAADDISQSSGLLLW